MTRYHYDQAARSVVQLAGFIYQVHIVQLGLLSPEELPRLSPMLAHTHPEQVMSESKTGLAAHIMWIEKSIEFETLSVSKLLYWIICTLVPL